MKLNDNERKFVDFCLTDGDWEETERIQLYRKLGKILDKNISSEKIKPIKKKIENGNKI